MTQKRFAISKDVNVLKQIIPVFPIHLIASQLAIFLATGERVLNEDFFIRNSCARMNPIRKNIDLEPALRDRMGVSNAAPTMFVKGIITRVYLGSAAEEFLSASEISIGRKDHAGVKKQVGVFGAFR